jgi:predicted phosphoribosyltransferase
MLARRLRSFRGREDVVVIALPRGGVAVGVEVALALHAPLDVCIVRKLGVPGQEELAMGAIASGGVCLINDDLVVALAIPPQQVQATASREFAELHRRERCYRAGRPIVEVRDRTAIVVDDGIATGATMRAAIDVMHARGAASVIVAVPVGAAKAIHQLWPHVDGVVCLWSPEPFNAIGCWYERFEHMDDSEVRRLLLTADEARPRVERSLT